MVIYGHSFALTIDIGYKDIFLKYNWGRYSGDLAIAMFFVISGFMVAGSFLLRENLLTPNGNPVIRKVIEPIGQIKNSIEQIFQGGHT